jgi:hypothetical protein
MSAFREEGKQNHGNRTVPRSSARTSGPGPARRFFGNSKRSIDGTHHSISHKHTGLYFAELDHKYNTRKMTDGERTVVGIRRMEGKRLMLHAPKRKAS